MEILLKIWNFILPLLPYIAGIITIILALLLFKQTKRKATADAESAEIKNIRELLEDVKKERLILLERVDKQDVIIAELQRKVTNHSDELLKKEMEIIDYEHILIKYKRALNFGDECKMPCGECPIKLKLKELNV